MAETEERRLAVPIQQERFTVVGTLGEQFIFTGPPAHYPNGIIEVSLREEQKIDKWIDVPLERWLQVDETHVALVSDFRLPTGSVLKITYLSPSASGGVVAVPPNGSPPLEGDFPVPPSSTAYTTVVATDIQSTLATLEALYVHIDPAVGADLILEYFDESEGWIPFDKVERTSAEWGDTAAVYQPYPALKMFGTSNVFRFGIKNNDTVQTIDVYYKLIMGRVV